MLRGFSLMVVVVGHGEGRGGGWVGGEAVMVYRCVCICLPVCLRGATGVVGFTFNNYPRGGLLAATAFWNEVCQPGLRVEWEGLLKPFLPTIVLFLFGGPWSKENNNTRRRAILGVVAAN
jgi:hypothetical protein